MNSSMPELPYLEFHVTDHCNLNCKGCTHFSPLANENNLEPTTLTNDMNRLSELFSNIARIRMLGGEPLLHPQIIELVKIVRRFFPKSFLSIVTNGILLPSMGRDFYETLKVNDVYLDITIYPLTEPLIPSAISLAQQYGIPIQFQDSKYFCSFLNINGDSDKSEMFKQCWVNYCTFLRNGQLYPCCLPALAHIVNNKFGWSIPGNGYIDIHTDITAEGILNFLRQPIPACAFCAKPFWFSWELSKRTPNEWTN